MKPLNKNTLIVNPNWKKTIGELQKKKIIFNENPVDGKINFGLPSDDGKKIQILEKNSFSFNLNPNSGKDLVLSYDVQAYDESWRKINTLSGDVWFTCHTLIKLDPKDYISMCELTANYITRNEDAVKDSEIFTLAAPDTSTGAKFNENYSEERSEFLKTNVTQNTILIIDGPLIGRNLASRTIKLVKDLKKNNILTFFVTKNSDSMLVTQKVAPGKYHSDMEWASKNLKPGQRSCFFKYKDQSYGHSEIFCYMKTYDKTSPLRISFYPIQYSENKDLVNEVIDMLYYSVLDDGNPGNPQIRFIRIAELFARDIIKLANPERQVWMAGLTPTVDQSRFGGRI